MLIIPLFLSLVVLEKIEKAQALLAIPINTPRGLNKDDLIEWKGTVSSRRRVGYLFVTARLSATVYYTVMQMQIRGYRYNLAFYAGSWHEEAPQGICKVGKGLIAPRKRFKFHLRFTSKAIMVYLNGALVFTQPFEIPTEYATINLRRISSIRVYGSANTERFQLLTEGKMVREMQLSTCGSISLGKSVPSFCPRKRHRNRENCRVVGGEPARAAYNPWQAAIRRKTVYGNDHPHVCGATLIGSSWAVTAAHCFLSTSPTSLRRLTFRVGDYYNDDHTAFSKISAFEKSDDVDIENVFLHEDYESYPNARNDIALIKLKRNVNFNAFVKPACLPMSANQFPSSSACGISGWGASNETQHTSEYPKCLQTAEVTIKSNTFCKRSFRNAFNSTIMMCAGNPCVDTCMGDSGGPLICKAGNSNNPRYTLWGITSWGIGCGDITRPGVYTRVSAYIKWLYFKMKLSPDDETLIRKSRQSKLLGLYCQNG